MTYLTSNNSCARQRRSRHNFHMKKRFAAIALLCFCVVQTAIAADGSSATAFRERTVALKGGTVVPRPGELIEAGTILLRDGLVVAVGKDIEIPANAEVIDVTGLFVYPGFIDAGATDLLDTEKEPTARPGRKVDFADYALAATQPDNRKGITPNARAAERWKADEKALNATRQLGFTVVHVVPTGRIASGFGALVATSDAPLRESLVLDPTFSEFELQSPRGEGYPQTLMGATAHLRQAFLDSERAALQAKLYREGVAEVARPPIDEALAAIERVRTGETRALFTASSRDDIHRTLRFCKEFNVNPVLLGGADVHRVLSELQASPVEFILQVDFGEEPKVEPNAISSELKSDVKAPLRVQQDKLNRWKERVTGLAKLRDAQIRFAVGSRGLKERAELLPNLHRAVELGLPADAALAAITTDAAAILGMSDRLGVLQPGSLAHVVVLSAPFADAKSKARYVFIDGRKYEYEADKDKESEAKPASTAETVDVKGTWNLQIETAEGTTPATLTLAQDGTRLTGSFESDQGNGRVLSGDLEGTSLKFVVGIGAGDRQMELKFSASLEENALSGDLKHAFGGATKWKGTRVTPAKSDENPVGLQLAETTPDKSKPVEAPKPDAQSAIDNLPTELESDRLKRARQTAGNALIKNATVLTGTRQTLPETSILVKDGKIAAIGQNLEAPEGTTVIDAAGRFVMPGIIDTHSHIMIGMGINEGTQSIVPEVRVKDVVNSDDPSEYRALAGGVTTIRILHGSANVVGGQDAVVKLKYGLPSQQQILNDAPQGVKFALGENVKGRSGRFPNTRLGVEATLNRAFIEAIDYRREWQAYEKQLAAAGNDGSKLMPPRRDLRLEALAKIVDHQIFIHSHCYRADEILMLMRVASNLGIRVWSLQHVLEGYKVAPEIVTHGASCATFSDWWAYKVEAYDAIPYNAALLHEAGANVCIKSDDWELMRHLYAEAAKIVRYGNVDPEVALQMITLNSAKQLGLDDRIGSIEVGKDADLAVFSGHPLNAFSRCELTMIDGEIYFERSNVVSAMLPDAAAATASPGTLALAPAEVRTRTIDIPDVASGRYAIVGATIHPVDGPDIDDGAVIIDGKTIAAIGRGQQIPSDAHVIDGSGLHVYPGLFDSGTTLGLTEIGQVSATHDYSEGGKFQPDLRAGVAINPDSELIPVARAGGITTVLMRPTGGVIAGQASLARLDGWTAPEMILEMEAGLQINLPTKSPTRDRAVVRRGDAQQPADEVDQRLKELRDLLEEARLYDRLRTEAANDATRGPIVDPRLEALRPYLRGEKPVFMEAKSRQEIAEAMLFAEKEKLKIVITGGTDAWKLADELKRREIPVIVGPVMTRPFENDPYDAPYANPGRLHAAGVKFSIRSDDASNSRNAPFEAATAVAYGLPEEAAVRALTLSAAEILNVSSTLGSLTPGKLANVVITDGSILQPSTQIRGVFIEGKPHAPESRHTRLYERYRGRLHEVKSPTGSAPATAGSGE